MGARERFYFIELYSATLPIHSVVGNCLNCFDNRCPRCHVPYEDMTPLERVVATDEESDREMYGEVLRAQGPIIREDVIQLWQSTGLTGFRTTPVSLVLPKDLKPLSIPTPKYLYVIVEGRVQFLAPPTKSVCPVCGFKKYAFEERTGIEVDASTWDGLDFFRPAFYTNIVMCTERAAHITLEAGYNKSLAFIKAERYHTWEPYEADKWTAEAYYQMREQYLIRDVADL